MLHYRSKPRNSLLLGPLHFMYFLFLYFNASYLAIMTLVNKPCHIIQHITSLYILMFSWKLFTTYLQSEPIFFSNCVRFEVITRIITINIISWDIAPYSQVEVHRYFGCLYCLCFQGRSVSQSETICLSPTSCCFITWLTFQLWRGRKQIPQKHRWPLLDYTVLHLSIQLLEQFISISLLWVIIDDHNSSRHEEITVQKLVLPPDNVCFSGL